MKFVDLGLSPEVLRALTDLSYEKPTPIQEQAIPVALQRRDLLGIAQTGTGKTAGFTLPMIDLLSQGRAKARMPRSLILEPTRELAAQVAESFERYGKYHKLSMALLIGGVSYDDQERKLDRGVDVLIATPGRLLDHFERGKLMLSGVQILVIDEADRMLDMGFIPDIERIGRLLPFTRQTMLFSATMPPEIQHLADNFLSNPVRVEVARPATTAENVAQKRIHVPGAPHEKRAALRALLKSLDVEMAIIFCNKKIDVDILAKSMQKHGLDAGPIHGDLDQSVRTATLEKFRSGQLKFLIASDVAARGLDIPAVSHVFNFDTPYHPDDYVHRIGRTGRAGRSGEAYTFVTGMDEKNIAAIIKLIGKDIPEAVIEGYVPGAEEPSDGESRGRRRGGRGDRAGGERGERAERGPRRNARSNRSDRPHGSEAPQPMVPAEPVAAAPSEPAKAEMEPRRAKEPRGHRGGSRSDASQTRPPREERSRGRDRRYRDKEDDTPVVGLGDHVPAFLLRATKLAKPKEAA